MRDLEREAGCAAAVVAAADLHLGRGLRYAFMPTRELDFRLFGLGMFLWVVRRRREVHAGPLGSRSIMALDPVLLHILRSGQRSFRGRCRSPYGWGRECDAESAGGSRLTSRLVTRLLSRLGFCLWADVSLDDGSIWMPLSEGSWACFRPRRWQSVTSSSVNGDVAIGALCPTERVSRVVWR